MGDMGKLHLLTNKNIFLDLYVQEFTLRALLLGIVLTLLMCAANIYLGLYAGMTVSASIPAAVISMGILRGVLRRGTILENNIVQTIASAGESLAAGIIFTIPALLIVGVWSEFSYWTTTLIALLGGTLGVLFMIPLRRILIVEEKGLIYPEGVACAQVLKTPEKRGKGLSYLFSALLIGAILKFLIKGISIIKPTVEGAIRLGRSLFYIGTDISVALLGVGYIVGPNISILVFLGGAIGWLLGIPLYGFIRGLPSANLLESSWHLWSTEIRYMGVGAMIVGGFWSILKIRGGMVRAIKETISGYRPLKPIRTEEDISFKKMLMGIIITAILIFILYSYLTNSTVTGITAGVIMVITSFFFVAVSSYIVGLVGSSNNPVSGMTICTILFASALLLLLGIRGGNGILATLGIAGVVCCAACTAGDISQDLKTGYIVGATPKRQQLAQIIGVIAPAFILAPILMVLHRAYGIGTGKPGALTAPQASLFASIVRAMFTNKSLPWDMIGIGVGIGVGLIIMDEILRSKKSQFRLYVMPVAVGIYLPLALSVPILLGGLSHLLVKSLANKEGINKGILFSSGLIAGEAIMGIIIAGIIFGGIKLPITIFQNTLFSIFVFLLMILSLIWTSLKR